MPYINDVGWKGQDTSKEAAQSTDAATLRKQVLAVFTSTSEYTADEVAALLGRDILSIRPRISELYASGFLAITDKKRKNASGKNAKVWCLAGNPFENCMNVIRAATCKQDLEACTKEPFASQFNLLDDNGQAAARASYKWKASQWT